MSEKRAMEVSGHKTRSCFERYHIVSLADIQESGAKMDKWVKEQRARAASAKASPRKQTRKIAASHKNSTPSAAPSRDGHAH